MGYKESNASIELILSPIDVGFYVVAEACAHEKVSPIAICLIDTGCKFSCIRVGRLDCGNLYPLTAPNLSLDLSK